MSRVVVGAVAAGVLAVCGSTAAAQPSFTGIGFLPGGGGVASSQAAAVSPDGSVVVGNGDRRPSALFVESVRWTRAGGIQSLGLPSSIVYSTGTAVAPGGAFVCGYHENGSNHYSAYRWTAATGMYQNLGDLPGGTTNSIAESISHDGKVIVGLGNYSVGGNGLGFIWQEGVGMFSMGDLPGGAVASDAIGVSGDGKVVVGDSSDADNPRPVMWRQETGLRVLPDLPGGTNFGIAMAASTDGRFIVGRSVDAAGFEAALWKDYGATVVNLGDLPGGPIIGLAKGVTDDGSIVVGYSSVAVGERGFIWDATHGTRDIKTVLETQYGLVLTGWTLSRVNSISADGTIICGDGTDPHGNFEGWVAVIPSPGAMVALPLAAISVITRRRRD